MCAGNELFFSMLYLINFYEGPFGLFKIILYLTAPISFVKSAISAVHLITAAKNIGNIDVADRATQKTQ
jgi:CDP-diacylglycerol--inositol 3-phosphatidyltransferase